MLLGAILFMLSQLAAQECPFRVKVNVIPATCYNNGMVAYALVDADDNVLTTVPAGLREVRAYYIMPDDSVKHYTAGFLVNSAGEMTSAIGWDTLTDIDHGDYTIGVEAMCGSAPPYTHLDTHHLVNIPTTYHKPALSELYVTANSEDGFGRHPTLECKNTGRIQLEIEGGRFPYHIVVVNHNDITDTLRVVDFDAPQYDGEDPTRYDYKNYYTLDSMPAGEWDTYLVDGCDYAPPHAGQIVSVQDYPLLSHVEVYSSTQHLRDSNVVKINAVLDRDFSYKANEIPDHVQYRFTYSGVFPDGDWKPMTEDLIEGFRFRLYDTVTSINKYCDLWYKDITLEYKVTTSCGTETTVSRTFRLLPPPTNFITIDSSDIVDSNFNVSGTCQDIYYWHRWYQEISYGYDQATKELLYTTAVTEIYYEYDEILGIYVPVVNSPYSVVTAGGDNERFRHHYTQPLTWVYYDTQRDTIIFQETVQEIFSKSRLYDTTVTRIYGSFESYDYRHPLMLPIRRTLIDAHGCEIYSTFDSLPYCYDVGVEVPDWRIYHTIGSHCCTTPGSVGVKEHDHIDIDHDGMTIELFESPYHNRYNFTAVYDGPNKVWHITKHNLANTASIRWEPMDQGVAGFVSLEDYCLPAGPYKFKVMTPCDTSIQGMNIPFPDEHNVVMLEEPELTYQQQCTDRYISYPKGLFAIEKRNADLETGLPLPPKYDTLHTVYSIIEGPLGGYDGTLHDAPELSRISMPGTFVARIYPSSSEELCEVPYHYDTIFYDGSTVDYVYAYAYVCDSTSTGGTAYVKATEGTLPYTYTIYSEHDKGGTVLGTYTTSDTAHPAIFNIPIHAGQHFSCMIEDGCGAHFHINLHAYSLADIQTNWFDGGITEITTCEGSIIQAHALEIADLLTYEWYNPANELIDSVASPTIFIPRNAQPGWYKVMIRDTGCQDSLVDSIHVSHIIKAPTLKLEQDDTVCPGKEVPVAFTPTSYIGADSITFTVAFENANGVETRTYREKSGGTTHDTYITYSDAKIYPLSIDDGECDYTIADEFDTIHIKMKTQMADACTLIGSRDTVCYGSDARFAGRSTMEKPYTIRWYSDYELTHLLKEETLTPGGPDTSYYDTLALTHHAEVFFVAEKDDYCPSVYGMPTNEMNLVDGTTTLTCGQVIRLYDDGGPDGNYLVGDPVSHTYTSSDGKPVTIHFDELDLSNTAHLYVLSGTDPLPDSVLYDLTHGSPNPGMITSRGSSLTLFFVPGLQSHQGWSAIVEHQPGISIADVYKKNEVMIEDIVCQSQTNTYADPYHVVPDVVPDIDILNSNLRHYGEYTYTKTLAGADQHGCDSTVTFLLIVNRPITHIDTTVVITNFSGGYEWHGTTHTTTGQHSYETATADGCDSLDLLNLIVLEIDTSNNEICEGETTEMVITVKEPEITWRDDDIPPLVNIGDVLCTDDTTLDPDSFLVSDKEAKGVVFFVDKTGVHGRAVALGQSTGGIAWADDYLVYEGNPIYDLHSQVHSLTQAATVLQAMEDFNGRGNTAEILRTARNAYYSQETYAEAAYFCHYYDHSTMTVGTDSLGWYLPAAGELYWISATRPEVNSTIEKLQSKYPHAVYVGYDPKGNHNEPISGDFGGLIYWSSTEYYSSAVRHYDHAWYLWGKHGSLDPINNEKWDGLGMFARPVCEF